MKPILWIGLLVLPLGVWGADAPVSSLGPTQAPPVKVTVSGGYGGDADLAGGGHIARWESAWDVEIPVNPTPRTGGRFSAGWGLTELDVGDLPGESVDALHTLSVGYFGVAPVKGEWSAFYRGGALMVFEEGAAGSDAWLYQGMAGLDRRVGPTLSLQAGLLGTTLLEEDPRVLPLLGFRWRPAPGWSVATEGLGIQVRGPLRPGAQFWVRSRWGSRAWRTDGDGAGSSGGVLVHEALRSEAGVSWEFHRGFQVEVRAGWETEASYRRLDDRGFDLGRREVDPAPIGGLALTGRF